MRIVNRFGRSLVSCGVAVLLSCGCSGAGEEPAPEQTAPDFGVSAGSLIVGLWHTPTHWIGFYETGPGQIMVAESFNMDKDKAVFGRKQIERGQYANAYRQVAGERLDQTKLARLEELDARLLRDAPASPASEQAPLFTAEGAQLKTPPADQLVNKEISQELAFFGAIFCGCLGVAGRPEPGQPATVPVCTNFPEVCSQTWQTGELRFKSKSFSAIVSNVGFTPATFGVYNVNSCENSSWWEVIRRKCQNAGTRVAFHEMVPRSTIAAQWSDPQAWTRRYEVNGSALMLLGLDVF
jgi:hypothetical protein